MAQFQSSTMIRSSAMMSPASISCLRYSLGQSRADFARTLGVTLETVFGWESGAQIPSASEVSLLIRLNQQSEAYAEKTALRPALERAIRDRRLEQIHASDYVLSVPDLTLN